MRCALSLIFLAAFWPAQLAAHSWTEGAEPLTTATVEALVLQLKSFEPEEIFSPPTQDDARDFLAEMSIRIGDPTGELTRLLFMYEAIRQGAVSGGQFSEGTSEFEWIELIYLEDFQPVSAHFGRIDEWFRSQPEAEQ